MSTSAGWSETMSGKPFRVSSLNGDGKYGIVARNLEELLQKGCQKLQLPQKGCRVCLFEDGTEIDKDYFFTLDDHCELIILEEGQEWNTGLHNSLKNVFNAFYENSEELTKVVNQMLSDETSLERKDFIQRLQNLIQSSDQNISAENREDDQKWFEGLNERFKTKSAYMRDNCGRRMRNYLNEVKNPGIELEGNIVNLYNAFVKRIERRLKENKFNECYFDRTADKGRRLCDNRGLFNCQGSFDCNSCEFHHSINPYSNKENRIIFSTWNLDHGIEKKRTIIPGIVEAVENKHTDDNMVEKFYENLFTVKNLKLVHIICHKKVKHNLSL
ncbi:DNA fragmentation factor subunit beta [Pristis pectinata]|uniref:DNA fragmentation factor subunit beta n=1 Tax=Pristis pectinata TaxID=685728 RepID=UPI00223D371B|nr:DNA fragmentation factor subunit beta [Pristis pectinata]